MPDTLIRSVTVAGGTALAVAALAAPIVHKLLLRLGSRQTVSEHVPEHAAKQGTPTMGGLIVVLGLLAGLLASGVDRIAFWVVLVVWFAMIGFLDDFVVPRMMTGKRGLGWMPKLGLQVLPFAALWAIAPATPWIVIAITGFVVLFFANAYNFADGMDGLAGGLGVILAGTLAAMSATGLENTPRVMVAMAALTLALIPFLFLNAPPAKVFMGDVGSLPIGAVLGMAFLETTVFREPGFTDTLYLAPGLLIAGVLLAELVPVPLQIASAKLRKGKRLFPFRTPVHHAFQAAGWPETRVVWMFLLVQLLLSLAGLAWCGWIGSAGVAD